MAGLEVAIYASLVLGFIIGFALSLRRVRSSRALDAISTVSILSLVFSMGLVVGSEALSIKGQAASVLLASVLLAALPGLVGSVIAQLVVRALEGGPEVGG